jgi:phosphoribosylformimino-5-aminoimidazole carboxamide ribotide isomerase
MEVIPVLDLRQGKAVHATGGDRSRYQVVRSAVAPGADGDPLALASAFRTRFGFQRCYVADLDALLGLGPQLGIIAGLADPASGFGPGLMVDGAAATAADALRLLASGATEVVVGLESLHRFEELAPIVTAVGARRLVFSLDLRDGRPVIAAGAADWAEGRSPEAIARLAADTGVTKILVLDLARVGALAGPALDVIRAVRAGSPEVTLLAGGGIRDAADLEVLQALGISGVLVGTALHRGGLAGYIESR